MINSDLSAQQMEQNRFNSIFVIEMMERFAFYAFNVIIVMFFIYQFHLPEAQAATLFGAFSALLYVFIPVGGWIGDYFLGTKRTIIIGGVFLLIGYLILASSMTVHMVFLGMGTIIIGNGFFKSNPASLLSKIFDKNDAAKRDAAYSMYYMAINVGSFVSEIVSPFVAHKFGWQWGFALAGIGLAIGVLNFTLGLKYFHGITSIGGEKGANLGRLIITIVAGIVLAILCSFLLRDVALTKTIMFTIVAIAFIVFLILAISLKPGARGKMISALILTLMAICFYSLYQQMFLSLTFFGMNNAAHNILGIPIHPEQFQVINPLAVIIIAPLLSVLYKRAGKRGKNKKITTKFAVGLLFSAFAFLVLVPSQGFAHAGIVSSYWIIAAYVLISIGELFVSALGPSMMSQLVPEKFMGFATGIWFLALAIAGVTGAMVSNMTSPKGANTMTAVQSLPVFCHAFLTIGIMTLGATVLMIIVKLCIDRFIYPKNI
ncbi:MAG: oligopeptide:H+ symporter [Fusobacteria bacterium]|nr:oligopeptide:H+ symporter [Fusobacteriota bacterium]